MKTDIKAQTLTIEGTIEPEDFKTYLKKKLHKHVDIAVDKKLAESSKAPVSVPEPEKKKESTEKEKPKEKSSSETTSNKIIIATGIQSKEDTNVANKNNVPYFIHYIYAPQLFSDENPNACRVM